MPAAQGAGLRFDGAEGGVLYGAAIVLDGTGQRADVTTVLSGNQLTLTVPAEFLARAEGPVLVDPVLSTWDVDPFVNENLLEPDVAYDRDTALIIYNTERSSTLSDIRGRLLDIPNAGGSQGTLCIGGAIGRYSNFVASSGTTGVITLSIDPTMLPIPTGSAPAIAGQARGFQLWHRDASGGGTATSNFTNAATIVFQ